MKFQLYPPQAIHQLGKRKNQEDTIFPLLGSATAADRMFIVCDGMGGHDKGEVASAAVCQGLSQYLQQHLHAGERLSDEMFEQAVDEAFNVLDAADTGHEGKMGTTMTFLCLHRGGCTVAHIGDSRIYHLRPQTGEVLYRSRDHSLVQQLYELGEISYNDMATSPRKNIILKAMQPYQEERSKATVVHITDILPGDYFYLCSDGMLEQMEDDELMDIVSAGTTDDEKAAKLIRRTEQNADNHSAYLIRIKDVETETGDDLLPSDEAEARMKNKALHDTSKDKAWDDATTSAASPRPATAKSAAQKGAGYKRYIVPLLLLIAVIVAAIVLFTGKKDSTPDDEDSTDDIETVEGDTDSSPAEDMEHKEPRTPSIRSTDTRYEDNIKLKGSAAEPDREPESTPEIKQSIQQ